MHEEATPKCIGTMKSESGESLVDLRMRFEEKHILNFPFQFWNVKECCRVAMALESFNDIEDSVFMIWALEVEDEFKHLGCKRQRIGSNTNVDASLHDNRESNDEQAEVLEVHEFPKLVDSGHADM